MEDINKNDFIPGTNIPKPRLRDAQESDEDYVQYLREYYESVFPVKETVEEVDNSFNISEMEKEDEDKIIETINENADKTVSETLESIKEDVQEILKEKESETKVSTSEIEIPELNIPVFTNPLSKEEQKVEETAAQEFSFNLEEPKEEVTVDDFVEEYGKEERQEGFVFDLTSKVVEEKESNISLNKKIVKKSFAERCKAALGKIKETVLNFYVENMSDVSFDELDRKPATR